MKIIGVTGGVGAGKSTVLDYLKETYHAHLILADLVRGNWASRVAIIASLFNFIIFYLISGRLDRFSPHQAYRRKTYKKKVKQVQPRGGITKHKCTVCGRTEQDGDDLEFRFCSKCDGNYEYCQDHLFTHQHIKKQ